MRGANLMSRTEKRPLGVTCHECFTDLPLTILEVRDESGLKRLSDPFEFKCPVCAEKLFYKKSEVRRLL